MNRTVSKRLSASAVTAGAMSAMLLGAAPAAHADTTHLTSNICTTEVFYNGQGLQITGHRCAQGRVHSVSSTSVLYQITTYDMNYTVTSGLSYGVHNNENPFTVKSGYERGTQSWLSPDNGCANCGWQNRAYPGAYSYKGQTVIHIDAYPDIPGASDPKLGLDTASF